MFFILFFISFCSSCLVLLMYTFLAYRSTLVPMPRCIILYLCIMLWVSCCAGGGVCVLMYLMWPAVAIPSTIETIPLPRLVHFVMGFSAMIMLLILGGLSFLFLDQSCVVCILLRPCNLSVPTPSALNCIVVLGASLHALTHHLHHLLHLIYIVSYT
jgi:hypothetical protein